MGAADSIAEDDREGNRVGGADSIAVGDREGKRVGVADSTAVGDREGNRVLDPLEVTDTVGMGPKVVHLRTGVAAAYTMSPG